MKHGVILTDPVKNEACAIQDFSIKTRDKLIYRIRLIPFEYIQIDFLNNIESNFTRKIRLVRIF